MIEFGVKKKKRTNKTKKKKKKKKEEEEERANTENEITFSSVKDHLLGEVSSFSSHLLLQVYVFLEFKHDENYLG